MSIRIADVTGKNKFYYSFQFTKTFYGILGKNEKRKHVLLKVLLSISGMICEISHPAAKGFGNDNQTIIFLRHL